MRFVLILCVGVLPLSCGVSTLEMEGGPRTGHPVPAPTPVVPVSPTPIVPADAGPEEPAGCVDGTRESCLTACGSTGTRECVTESWGSCHPPVETCDNGVDDDCDGKVDGADFDCPSKKHTCEESDGNGCNGDLGYGDHCAPEDNESGCSASRFHAWCNRRNPATPDLWDGWVEGWVDTRCDGAVSQNGATFHCLSSSNEIYECTTPLVLAFGGTPVRFEPSLRSFDFTPGQPATSDWPTAASPWLARDLDGNGRIDDGSELFGSNTRLSHGQTAPHGFAALEALDANGDGLIDDADPLFATLRVWRDRNRDHVSQPGELSTLRQEGVTSLSLAYRDEPRCDDRGNCERQRARFTGVRGGAVVDVYLRLSGPVACR